MRLFIAVDLDPGVATAAAALVDDLRGRVAQLAPRARITWIPRERLHLTVRFIGDAGDDLTRALESALAPPLPVTGFDLVCGDVGAFPRGGKPQVLWAGIVEGLSQLQAVEHEVSQRLESVGIARERRSYSPHLTLARVRDAAGLRSQALFGALENTALGTSAVEAITLYESRLSPRGPTYRPLQRIPLKAR